MTKRDSSRIQGTEMRVLRLQNTKIREILKLDRIQDDIEDSKIRWYGHVKRMNTGRIPRQALEYQLGGKRSQRSAKI